MMRRSVAPTAQIEVHGRGWRSDLQRLISSAMDEVFIAAPYVKHSEAEWLCRQVAPGCRVRLLTDISAASVLERALDIDALLAIKAVDPSEVITLPRLHAKVYVADARHAIVSSANLTASGLGTNYEYGLGVSEPSVVARIRVDLEQYAALGNALSIEALTSLQTTASALLDERDAMEASTDLALRRRFRDAVSEATTRFLAAHVGDRSANDLFGEAIRIVLREGPLTTQEIAPRVQQLLPDYCDDSRELVINGERFGKAWKHTLRNAQQHLKRRGVIEYDNATRLWTMAAR